MRAQTLSTLAALALAGVLEPLALAACNLDVPDLNDPSLDDLQNHPNAISIGAACTGLLIGNRGNMAAETGYVVQLGILGREAYNFDAADPRYIAELLAGTLVSGDQFGGNFWPRPYANLQLGNVILGALDKVTDLSDAAKAAIRGFTRTINALDLLQVVVTHGSNGAVLDLNPDPRSPLPPIVTDTAQQYAKIASLLDGAIADLQAAKAGGDAFPFALGRGFANFNVPSTFHMFNRAIRARVAAYAGDYRMVLTALGVDRDPSSLGRLFLNHDPTTLDDLNAGVYYVYSTKPGDTPSQLINPNLFVHPSIEADAAHDAMNNPIDARLLRKTGVAMKPPANPRVTAGLPQHPGDGSLLPVLTFAKLYPSPEASVPLIRNEELILLEAEARWFTGDQLGAMTALNTVRMLSGNLPAIDQITIADDAGFVAALLYERKYSLLFEGGHRWIDARRLHQLDTLPIYVTVDPKTGKMTPDQRNIRYLIPLPECNARPGEPTCRLGSTDG